MKKYAYLFCGVSFLLFGVVGLFLPILPTTPFLLVAAFCLDRGSLKFHNWLVLHPRLGPPIRDWQERRVIRRPAKQMATVLIVLSTGLVCFSGGILAYGKWIYYFFIIGVLVFVWRQKSS